MKAGHGLEIDHVWDQVLRYGDGLCVEIFSNV